MNCRGFTVTVFVRCWERTSYDPRTKKREHTVRTQNRTRWFASRNIPSQAVQQKNHARQLQRISRHGLIIEGMYACRSAGRDLLLASRDNGQVSSRFWIGMAWFVVRRSFSSSKSDEIKNTKKGRRSRTNEAQRGIKLIPAIVYLRRIRDDAEKGRSRSSNTGYEILYGLRRGLIKIRWYLANNKFSFRWLKNRSKSNKSQTTSLVATGDTVLHSSLHRNKINKMIKGMEKGRGGFKLLER